MMAQQQFEEPPELFDSSGEKIVVFRRPDGTLFSNHPEYQFAMAMYQQAQTKAAETEAPAVDTEDMVDDEPQEQNNNDGVTSYEEMTSADLLQLTRERKLILPDKKRSTAIAALEEYDAEHEKSE
jgi:short-subunit dehydrogenase involved in D-alanine esterification of teichoic acids